MEVDVSKPLKRTLKYVLDGVCHECLLDYENITIICFGCGSQSQKFDTCRFNSRNIALKLENFQELSQADESQDLFNENKMETWDANWVEVPLKRTSRAYRNQGKIVMKSTHKTNSTFQDVNVSKNPSPTNFSASTSFLGKNPNGLACLANLGILDGTCQRLRSVFPPLQ